MTCKSTTKIYSPATAFMHRRAQLFPVSRASSSAQIQAVQNHSCAFQCLHQTPPSIKRSAVPVTASPKKSAIQAIIHRTAEAKQVSSACPRLFPVRLHSVPQRTIHPRCASIPRYSGRNSANKIRIAAIPRPLLSNWMPARTASEASLKLCPTMGMVPVRNCPVRNAVRSSCAAEMRWNPNSAASSFPVRESPFCSSVPAALHRFPRQLCSVIQQAMLNAR